MRTLAAALTTVTLLCVPACKPKESAAPAPAPAAAEQPQPPAPPVPPLSTWALDPENSSVGFACKHVLSNVRGMFQRPSGTVTWDETTPANSKVNATIDVTTISTGVEERDSHLKSPDFFDTAKYPSATFVSTSCTRASTNTYSMTGDLTMHGITKPVTLAVTASAPFNHAGGIRRGIEATGSINRKDFGLKWEYPGEGPGMVVGDTIKLTIDAELVLQP